MIYPIKIPITAGLYPIFRHIQLLKDVETPSKMWFGQGNIWKICFFNVTKIDVPKIQMSKHVEINCHPLGIEKPLW